MATLTMERQTIEARVSGQQLDYSRAEEVQNTQDRVKWFFSAARSGGGWTGRNYKKNLAGRASREAKS